MRWTLIAAVGWLALAGPVARADDPTRPLPPGAVGRLGAPRPHLGRPVSHLEFSPDGSYVAGAAADATIRLWDAATGAERVRIDGLPGQHVVALAVAPDGKAVAAASDQPGRITVWDAATGRERRTWAVGTGRVGGLAFLPGGERVCGPVHPTTASAGPAFVTWDAASGREVSKFDLSADQFSTLFAVSPDGRSVAITGNARPPRVLDAATGAVTAECAALKAGAAAVAYTPDGKSLVLAGLDGKVHVWEPAGAAPPRTIKPTTLGIAHLRMSADGKTVALTGHQGGVRVLDLASGAERRAWPAPAARLAISPDGSVLAVARGPAAGLQLLEVATGIDRVRGDGHDSLVTGLAFAADGRTLVTAAADRVCVWDVAGRKLVKSLADAAGTPFRVAVRPDGRQAAIAGTGRAPGVLVWDLDAGQVTHRLTDFQHSVYGLAYSPDGRTFAAADRAVRLFDAATGQEVRRLDEQGGVVQSVAFSPDGKLLASTGHDVAVRVYDLASGREVRRFDHPTRTATPVVAFSPDGRWLAGSSGGQVRVWDVATGEQRASFAATPRNGLVQFLAFTPDGKALVAGGNDGAAAAWDWPAGRQLHAVPGDGRLGYRSAALAPDGKLLATGAGDGTVLLWPLKDVGGAVAAAPPAAPPPPPGPTPEAAESEPLPDGAVARLGSARLRHPRSVSGLAFSNDGTTVASSGSDGAIRLWDAATGRPGRVFDQKDWLPTELAYSPDGATLAVSAREAVRLLDAVTGRHRLDCTAAKVRPGPHASRAVGLSFSGDGRTLAAASLMEPVAWVWDATTGRLVRRFDLPRPAARVALSPDGRVLAATDVQGELRLLEVASGQPRAHAPPAGKGGASSLVFLPDNRTLLVGHYYGPIIAWDVDANAEVRRFGDARPGRTHFALTPDGKTLAVGVGDGRVVVFDVAAGAVRHALSVPAGAGSAANLIAIAPDGRTVAAAFRGPTISLVDVATGRSRGGAGGHAGAAFAAAFGPDGRTLTTVGDDGAITWELATRRPRAAVPLPGLRAAAAAFTPDGRTAVVTGVAPDTARSLGAALLMWDLGGDAPPRRVGDLPLHPGRAAIAPDGKTVAVTEHEAVTLRDAATGAVRHRLHTDRSSVSRVAFSPDGKSVAVGTGVGGRLYDTQTGRQVRSFGSWPADGLAFSPDGRLLAVASTFGALRVWDLADTRLDPWATWEATEPRVYLPTVTFVAGGRAVAAGGTDGAVRVWELATGRRVVKWAGHAGPVLALAVSPDGKLLASVGEEGSTFAWDLTRLGRLADTPLADTLRPLWDDLAAPDAAKAFAAIRGLAADPDRAVPFLRDRLKPRPADDRAIARLIVRVNGEDATARDFAAAELAKLGPAAEPALRQSLRGVLTPEGRAAVEKLLKDKPEPDPAADELRQVRAVEALERMATPAAARLLEELAGGPADARLTQEAKAAAERLKKRP